MKNIDFSKIFINIGILSILLLFTQGCLKDLDTIPLDDEIITSGVVYDDPDSYIKVLAKLYAGLAVSGQEGPAGKPDISGIDEGFGQYLRGLWYHQELTTDEAVIAWNDQTIKDFHNQTWGSDDGFTFAFYSRVFYQIPLCNEFLRETSDEKLESREVDAALKEEIQGYRAEARFLRALSYWHALDIFRNVPFVTEDDKVGSFFPEQINGPDLFNYIESELKAIETEINPVGTALYGRVDQGAVWTLLAKLYLNAEVYTGSSKWGEALTYCEKVIESDKYNLDPNYQQLFLADNHNAEGVIFPVPFDGVYTKTWGGTTFILRAGIGGDMDPTLSGVASGWAGTRATKEFVSKFPENIGGYVMEANEGNTSSYPKIYLPGGHQGWDPTDQEVAINSPNGDNIFEGYQYYSEANTPILIARYPSMDLTYGDNGNDGSLEIGGDTIRTGNPGLYFIQVNLSAKTYILEKRDWAVIGDATPGGWDSDTPMSLDPERKVVTIMVDLIPGAMKFRANQNWDANLGDDDFNGILTQDGADIQILEGGNYEITLFIDKPDYTYEMINNSTDSRGYFYSNGQNLEIEDLTLFTDGYAINKFKNVDINGNGGSNPEHVDTDFPMFRLADVYLMAAEAIYRDGTDLSKAVNYFNKVRERAYRGSAGNISESDLSEDLLLDERARELYWECHRRTDLIRFGKFSESNYLWEWKGGQKDGLSVGSFRDIFPIPSADINANINLVQNPGY